MKCPDCSRFPVPTSNFVSYGVNESRHSELFQCIGCGEFIDVVAEERTEKRISDSEAQERYGLIPGTYPNRIDYQRVSKASEAIRSICRKELKKGNRLVETSEGWPAEGITLWLKSDFHSDYSSESLEFRNLNDPHYWKDEYRDLNSGDIIACKF